MLHKALFRIGDIVKRDDITEQITGCMYLSHTWAGGDGFGYNTDVTRSGSYGFMAFDEGRLVSQFLDISSCDRFCM